jgi:CheY-like chemotaxis protein
VVEDDPEAAEYFTHVLTKHGHFHVTHTPDPAVALTLAASQHWDLVLTDLDLPFMSGLELLAALRRMTPNLPVVLVTGHALDTPPSSPSAPNKILRKPIPSIDLLAAITPLIQTP